MLQSRGSRSLWRSKVKVTQWFKYVVTKVSTSMLGRRSPSSVTYLFTNVLTYLRVRCRRRRSCATWRWTMLGWRTREPSSPRISRWQSTRSYRASLSSSPSSWSSSAPDQRTSARSVSATRRHCNSGRPGAIIRLEAAWRHRLACVHEVARRPAVECYRRRQTTTDTSDRY